jgi:hypothetical protein
MGKQTGLRRQGFRLSVLTSGLIFALLQTTRLQAQTYQVIIYDPPPGFDETRGEGIGGQQRVGAARIAGATLPENTHAFLWTGNSSPPVDLHPPNWTYSWATATNGTQQAGYVEGQNPPYSGRRAALWSGTPDSLVLLWPLSEWGESEVSSIAGNQQVGYLDRSFCGNGGIDGGGGCTYRIHAALWSGTAGSWADLHPTALVGASAPGDQRSKAFDTDGTSQVGYVDLLLPLGGGSYTSETHALLWHGTGQSAIDLHPQGWDVSYAYGIKNNTQVGYGTQTSGFSPIMAFVWHGSAESRVSLGEGTVLDTNGATHVGAIGVDNSSHAFRWDGDSGNGFDLNALLPPGYINSGASDINEEGDIIGWAQNPSGYLVGVLWRTSSGPSPTPQPTATPPATPTPTVEPTASPNPTPAPTATPVPSPVITPTPGPISAQPLNLSTRMYVQTGDNVGIGGFIITGNAPKHVLIRAIGPSLSASGISAVLVDPILELHGPAGFLTILNDNWREQQESEIRATGIPPSNDLESAIDATLAPGSYTAVVRGNNGASGTALVEVYDLDRLPSSKMANISTRAFVDRGENIVIAGFILGNNAGNDKVVVRGIGPSLTTAGVPNALTNPTLELRDSNGALLNANDNWQDDPLQVQELTVVGLAPANSLESSITATLPPGAYTALLAGANNENGIGLVEIYDRRAP